MSKYFQTSELTLDSFDPEKITQMYNQGYVLTRVSKGNMIQTRSLRIDLSKFELSSENRRILRKNEDLILKFENLPLENYSWEIHKLGKEFYTTKFGDGTMSAQKIKEMFNEVDKSNMNGAFVFEIPNSKTQISDQPTSGQNPVGYCLVYTNQEITHYAYPFYDLTIPKEQSLGLAMMMKAIIWAKDNGKKYMYLGSIVEPESKYKLQFSGLEWWDNDNEMWNSDLTKVKELLEEKP
jgi:leucyl-tRNA---protein transferase